MSRKYQVNRRKFLQYKISVQLEKGSPVKPTLQEHTGLCLITVQSELMPQDPSQGFEHLSFIHARLLGQSADCIHSGRQLGDLPI